MLNTPTVSIITPTYNRGRLLTRVWSSIRGQATELEWIVVNDGCTDDTDNVMAAIDDPRVVYLKHDKNRGVNAARNTGSGVARGKYIIFLDSDDELVDRALKPALDVLEKADARIGVALFACVMAESGNSVTNISDGRVLDELDIVCEDGLKVGGDMICIYRREVFEQFSLPEQLQGCEQVFIFEISKLYLFLMVDKPLSIVHRQQDNLSRSDSIIARSSDIAKSCEIILDNHIDIFNHCPNARVKWQTRAMYRYGVAGTRRDVWRLYGRIYSEIGSLQQKVKATFLLPLCLLGISHFERLRINRINRQLDRLQND